MKNKIALSASLMCADLLNLEKDLRALEKAKAEYLHLDIMDGTFVPNYTLGTDLCRRLKEATPLPLDIHLMIADPLFKYSRFPFSEGDIVSVHYESGYDIHRVLGELKEKGATTLLALNPATPVESVRDCLGVCDGILVMTVNPGFAGQKMFPGAVDKVKRTRELIGEDRILEVDGNVSFETAPRLTEAGADLLVCGSSSLFRKDGSLEANAAKLRALCQ